MATWHIYIDGCDVVLRYWNGAGWQDCGRAPRELQRDLLAFCASQAQPFDVLLTPAGSFVTQPAPASEMHQ